MKIINGYPTHIVFKTEQEAVIDITCDGKNIKVVYDCKGEITEYFIKETKQNKLVMNK